MRRVILTTGGTGGHVFPALAVAEALQDQGVACLFVGSEHGREAEWVAEAGLDFVGLPVRGVLGRGVRGLGSLGLMALSVVRAGKILRDFRPDAVAGFGSYASFATLAAARLRGVPVVVHEQNAFPGLTNRIMGRMARQICLSVPPDCGCGGPSFQPEKCVWTGNPVRRSFLQGSRKHVHDCGEHAPRLLVLGGSLGAKAVNSVILAGLPRLAEAGVAIRHQTGHADYERVAAGYRAHGLSTEGVTPFIGDMPEAYAWADLVLCRAGASTVAELAVCARPALFIPFPHATHDHQTCNARVVCHEGAGMILAEKDLTRKDAVGLVLMLLHDRDQLAVMSRAAREMAKPEAADNVAAVIMRVMERQDRAETVL